MSTGQWMLEIDQLLLEQGHEINGYFVSRLNALGIPLEFTIKYIKGVIESLQKGVVFLEDE